jgi:hypothetical protein
MQDKITKHRSYSYHIKYKNIIQVPAPPQVANMKYRNTLSILALLAISISAQTSCDPVASAIPTCGVSFPFLLFHAQSYIHLPPFSRQDNSQSSHLIISRQVPCIASAASAAGCGTGDYVCRCSSAEVIQNSALGCVVGNCGIATALQVQASASAVCACVTGAP